MNAQHFFIFYSNDEGYPMLMIIARYALLNNNKC
jgi:hypothetical protein